MSDQIAAIAPVEGCLYSTQKPLASPVSVIAFHGRQDFLVPYDGGVGSMYGYKLKATPVIDAVQYFLQQNHCNPQPVRDSGGFHVERELYAGGDSGTEVCLYTLDCGGHAWPGGRRFRFIGDKPRNDVCATETMCRFFFAHPKQHPAPPDNSIGAVNSKRRWHPAVNDLMIGA